MKTVEPTNGFQVCGWMVTDLHLEGLELAVFALVHTFSQGRAGKYTGGAGYICSWFGISKPTALKYLQGLTERGLIEREEKEINGVKFVEYTTGKEFLRGVKNLNGGVKNFYPDNKYNNPPVVYISPNGDNNTTTPQGVSRPKFSKIEQMFLACGAKEEDLRDWKTARKGAPITEAVFNGMEREARKANIDIAQAVRICAENSWRGFRAAYLEGKKGSTTQQGGRTYMGDIKATYAKLQARWDEMGGQQQ